MQCFDSQLPLSSSCCCRCTAYYRAAAAAWPQVPGTMRFLPHPALPCSFAQWPSGSKRGARVTEHALLLAEEKLHLRPGVAFVSCTVCNAHNRSTRRWRLADMPSVRKRQGGSWSPGVQSQLKAKSRLLWTTNAVDTWQQLRCAIPCRSRRNIVRWQMIVARTAALLTPRPPRTFKPSLRTPLRSHTANPQSCSCPLA